MKKGHSEFYHSFMKKFSTFREDYIKCLAYEMYIHGHDSLSGVTRSGVKKLMGKCFYLYGRCGWQGATDTDQAMGPDDMDEYNICYDKAAEIITSLYPKLLSREKLMGQENDTN